MTWGAVRSTQCLPFVIDAKRDDTSSVMREHTVISHTDLAFSLYKFDSMMSLRYS